METSVYVCAFPTLARSVHDTRASTVPMTGTFRHSLSIQRWLAKGAAVPPCCVNRKAVISMAVTDENQPAEPEQKDGSKIFKIAVVVFVTLGFVDAGYSGDWSRIGAITKEAEEYLRPAAFVVVPASALLVWLIARTPAE